MKLDFNQIKLHKMDRLLPPRAAFSVLIPLVENKEDETGYSVLFEVRSADIPQGGEICFPGGMIEEGERGTETAIRETAEELLISEDNVEVIAPVLEQLGPSNRPIRSYLGILHDYKGTYSKDEVARVFTIPLSWLLTSEPLVANVTYSMDESEDFPYDLIPGGKNYPFAKYKRSFWFYKTEEGNIWGITAEILNSMLNLLKEKND